MTQKHIHSSSGKTCYIIGSGPSVRKVDLKSLQGDLIGVNESAIHAAEYLKYAYVSNVNYFQHPLFWRVNAERLTTFTTIPESSFNKLHLHKNYHMNRMGIVYFQGLSRDTLEISHGEEEGKPSCAGFGALNLAYLMGYREIGLIGFDLLPTYRPYWYSKANSRRYADKDKCAAKARTFNNALPYLNREEAPPVTVFNMNTESLISCFPKTGFNCII